MLVVGRQKDRRRPLQGSVGVWEARVTGLSAAEKVPKGLQACRGSWQSRRKE